MKDKEEEVGDEENDEDMEDEEEEEESYDSEEEESSVSDLYISNCNCRIIALLLLMKKLRKNLWNKCQESMLKRSLKRRKKRKREISN